MITIISASTSLFLLPGSSGAGSHTDKLHENRISGNLFANYYKKNFWFCLLAKEIVLLDTACF